MTKPKPTKEDLARVAEDLHPLMVPIDSLNADPENPRDHPEENLEDIAASLELYGQQKAVVTTPNGTDVIAGNGTLTAALSLGWRWLARSRARNLDEVKVRGYKIADNQTALTSVWNREVLGRELGFLTEEGGLEPRQLGFTADEVVRYRDVGAFDNGAPGGSGEEGQEPGTEPTAGGEPTRMALSFDLETEDFQFCLETLKLARERHDVGSDKALVAICRQWREDHGS